ncbi:MAG: VCBS repeat-containing protein [Woeseiaceae bacterium]
MLTTQRISLAILLSAHLYGCGGSGGGTTAPPGPSQPPSAAFAEVSAANLPVASLAGRCMDADHGDVDGDGDVDLVLAQEIARNIVLLNDGSGVFTLANGAVNGGFGDNEDVRLVDFDGDGDLDMFTAHEDDAVHSLLINDGSGVFTEAAAAIPVNSIANAAEVIDLNADTRPDILLGNAGTNIVLLQLANGTFIDETTNRPIGTGTTQDLLLIDIDGDNDLDLLSANELDNDLFVNDGNGFFVNETATRLPANDGETREADAADVDSDGDLDIILGNVSFNSGRPPQNRLLLNDGSGVFADATASNLAGLVNQSSSFTIRFVDIDDDGDADVLSPRNDLGQGGDIEVWLNDGSGVFSPASSSPFSAPPNGSTFDIEVVDLNADGKDDIYFCHRTGTDQLYFRN